MITGVLAAAAVSMQGELHGDGELFFALQGPNFDGHDYVAAAEQAGAAGAVVTRVVGGTLSQVTVDDTRAEGERLKVIVGGGGSGVPWNRYPSR